MAANVLERIQDSIGLSRRWFTEKGFDLIEVRNSVLKNVNSVRLRNNPIILHEEFLKTIITSLW
jgi:hypothetical protein